MMTLWGSVWAEVPGPLRLTKNGFLQKAMTFQFHASPCSFTSNTHQTTTPCFHELHYARSTHYRQRHTQIHPHLVTFSCLPSFCPQVPAQILPARDTESSIWNRLMRNRLRTEGRTDDENNNTYHLLGTQLCKILSHRLAILFSFPQ